MDPSRNRLASTAYFAITSSIILGGLLSGGFCPGDFCPGGLLTGYQKNMVSVRRQAKKGVLALERDIFRSILLHYADQDELGQESQSLS